MFPLVSETARTQYMPGMAKVDAVKLPDEVELGDDETGAIEGTGPELGDPLALPVKNRPAPESDGEANRPRRAAPKLLQAQEGHHRKGLPAEPPHQCQGGTLCRQRKGFILGICNPRFWRCGVSSLPVANAQAGRGAKLPQAGDGSHPASGKPAHN